MGCSIFTRSYILTHAPIGAKVARGRSLQHSLFFVYWIYMYRKSMIYIYILSTSINICFSILTYIILYIYLSVCLFVCLYVAVSREHLHEVSQAEHWVLQLHGKGRLEAKKVLVAGFCDRLVGEIFYWSDSNFDQNYIWDIILVLSGLYPI